MERIPRAADGLARSVCALLRAEGDDALGAAIGQLIETARETYSDFTPGPEALSRQLQACLDGEAQDTWAAKIAALSAADIWLCAALVDGDPAAVRVFERRLDPEIRLALGRFSLSDDQRAELAQRVRVRLLVGTEDSPARIGLYRGWGSLEGWARTISARLALNAIRDRKEAVPLSRSPDLLGVSPEFEALRSNRRTLFLDALREAFRSLGQRERALLRLRYLDGVQANALARSYGVHESTMSRWLAGARTELQARFEAKARALVKEDAAVAELLGVMQSRFGESLQQLFVSELADSTEP